jgi:hypothetical protein
MASSCSGTRVVGFSPADGKEIGLQQRVRIARNRGYGGLALRIATIEFSD